MLRRLRHADYCDLFIAENWFRHLHWLPVTIYRMNELMRFISFYAVEFLDLLSIEQVFGMFFKFFSTYDFNDINEFRWKL